MNCREIVLMRVRQYHQATARSCDFGCRRAQGSRLKRYFLLWRRIQQKDAGEQLGDSCVAACFLPNDDSDVKRRFDWLKGVESSSKWSRSVLFDAHRFKFAEKRGQTVPAFRKIHAPTALGEVRRSLPHQTIAFRL